MSEPNKIRKWVVEKFDGISPGLLGIRISLNPTTGIPNYWDTNCMQNNIYGKAKINAD